MPPVYQPEVVAEAIHLAAVRGGREMPLSSTTVLFSVAVRLVPGLVGRAIRHLGYGGQITEDAAALARYEPTLFAPSDRVGATRGGFRQEASARSLHVRALYRLARLKPPSGGGPTATPLANLPARSGPWWRRRPS